MPLLDTCEFLKTQKSPNKNFSFHHILTCQWPLKSATVSVCLFMTLYILALKISRALHYYIETKPLIQKNLKNFDMFSYESTFMKTGPYSRSDQNKPCGILQKLQPIFLFFFGKLWIPKSHQKKLQQFLGPGVEKCQHGQ